jgi:hypothetical protein
MKVKYNTKRYNQIAKQLLYGVDFSSVKPNMMSFQTISPLGLSLLPFDLDIYKKTGIMACSPFVKGDLPLEWKMKYHL